MDQDSVMDQGRKSGTNESQDQKADEKYGMRVSLGYMALSSKGETVMSVYKKLQDARIKLQKMQLKKSGQNTYAGYAYYELGDFLPQIQEIFSELGLCGVISFSDTIATLTIVDTETGNTILITSPMSKAALKGCHEVQNLGAVETYLRRYLWQTALEIVESDAVNKTKTEEAVIDATPEEVYAELNKAAAQGDKALTEAIKKTKPHHIALLTKEQKKALRDAASIVGA